MTRDRPAPPSEPQREHAEVVETKYQDPEPAPSKPATTAIATRSKAVRAAQTIATHLKSHVGAGVLASVAYFDPGNWSVDLQAGSQFGYSLLFVVFASGLGAAFLQTLACRLGCVTGLDLATHCRLLFGNHPRHPKRFRYIFLYPLYLICEIAIIATDLAELLGSAIGLSLLIPALPLWAGVTLTSLDVLLVLALCQDGRRPSRLLEAIVIGMVLATFIAFAVLMVKVQPHWQQVMSGYLPSHTLLESGAVYISIGILGATVMPHALFLGSSLATQNRASANPGLPPPSVLPTRVQTVRHIFKSLFAISSTDEKSLASSVPRGERSNNTLNFIQAHLKHAVVDMVASLLGFAMLINSAILILAATVFFVQHPGPPASESAEPAGLFDVHTLIVDRIGPAAGILFAFALLCAGQSASITATLAGQIVSEGFIQWRISPFMRRLITRLIGLVPSMAVAIAAGRPGIDALLVGSQVTLSFVLPFVIFPLVYLTSSPVVMAVADAAPATYHNGRIVAGLGYLIFTVILIANGYVIVALATGAKSA